MKARLKFIGLNLLFFLYFPFMLGFEPIVWTITGKTLFKRIFDAIDRADEACHPGEVRIYL